MNIEDTYRRMAVFFIKKMEETRTLFKGHLPSIGYVGEQLLRQALKEVLPNDYAVCQGFIINPTTEDKDNLSNQCDIIIYRKGNGAVMYSVGALKVINTCFVVAVIEVKSSIKKKTFITTIESFEKLENLRVRNKFIFVFGALSKRSLSSWFSQNRVPENKKGTFFVIDTELYDWSDKERLPNSILSLESCKYYVLDHLQDEKNDWVGYASYKITDKKDKEISCLQEFFASVMDLINGTFEIDRSDYSVKDGFPLWH